MGKKYIIELEDENYHQQSDSEPSDCLWRVKGFNSLVFDEVGLRKLTPYTEPDIEQIKDETYMAGYETGREAERVRQPNLVRQPDIGQVRKEAYKEGREAGIKDGMCEAWEVARKICSSDRMTSDVRKAIFGWSLSESVMDRFNASEALEKLRAYEQKQDAEIKVWDEICCIANPDIKVCVTNIEDGYFSGFTIKHPDKSNIGKVYSHRDIVGWEKTGDYFPEIAIILEKMKNESNAQIDT